MTDKLCIPDGIDLIDRFEFTNYPIFDQNIQPKSFIEQDAVVVDRHWYLSFNSQATLREFVAKTHFINPLQEAGTELFVDEKRAIYNQGRNAFFFRRQRLKVRSQS
jgi:hypothetical protein